MTSNNPSDATVSDAMLVAGHRAWADLLVDESVVDSDDGLTRLWIAMTSAREQPDGYVGAYYEITSLLGIGAQPLPPKQVHENLVMPSLRRLVAQSTAREQPVGDEGLREKAIRAVSQIASENLSSLWGDDAMTRKEIILLARKALATPDSKEPTHD